MGFGYNQRQMIRLGLASGAIFGISAEQVVETAVRAGLDGIEWASDAHLPYGDLKSAERLMLLTLRANLSPLGYATLFRVNGHSREAFDSVIETARRLQAPLVRVFAGHGPRDRLDEAGRAAFVDAARSAADVAGKAGITLCFRVNRNTLFDSYASAVSFLARIDHPFARMSWEPGACFDDSMRQFTQFPVHVPVIYARPFAEDFSRPMLREKEEDWILYLDALEEQAESHDMAHYVVICTVKDDDKANLAADVDLLRKWAVKLRRYRKRRLL